jgi:peroxiredoxin
MKPLPILLGIAIAGAITVGAIAVATVAGLAQRDAAPTVAYTLLDGTRANTAQWRGKVVLVNFWATSCTTCVREMPQLAALHDNFKARGFDTLAVSMRYDPPSAVVDFSASRRLPFGVAIDNTGAIAQGFGDVQVTPTTLLIDKRGDIALRIVGTPDFAALNAQIERLLAAPA